MLLFWSRGACPCSPHKHTTFLLPRPRPCAYFNQTIIFIQQAPQSPFSAPAARQRNIPLEQYLPQRSGQVHALAHHGESRGPVQLLPPGIEHRDVEPDGVVAPQLGCAVVE